jgi:hypothetical protein
MFAILAAVLFGLALIFDLANTNLGSTVNVGTLQLAGLLCIALHLAGIGTVWRGRWRRRR